MSKTIKIMKLPNDLNEAIEYVASLQTDNSCGPWEDDFEENKLLLTIKMNKIINTYYDPTKDDRNWPYIKKEQRDELYSYVRAYKYKYPQKGLPQQWAHHKKLKC